MKLLFASDSYKGSLSCGRIIELLTKAAKEVMPDSVCTGIPVADGGEGTVDAVLSAVGGERIFLNVHGPLMEIVKASYGIFDGNRAIIEMSAASGLPLVPQDKRNPLKTTTYGTGEMILDALRRGCTDITVAIGGSATNDGGMGCLSALGVVFSNRSGDRLSGRGEDLENVESIDISGIDPLTERMSLTVMNDVCNPLCGNNGATRIFGPQKGATPEMIERLEKGMISYRNAIIRSTGIDPDDIPGSGAAGGLGAALGILLKGKMKSGVETVLDLVHFDDHLEDTDMVITGEGRADAQSCMGKVMQGIGLRAKAKGIPVIGLCGSIGDGAERLYDYGITSLFSIIDKPMTLEEAMNDAERLYYMSAIRLFRIINDFYPVGRK